MSEENKLSPIINFIGVDDKKIVATIKQQLQDGLVNPLEIYLGLKRLDKIIKGTIDGSEGDKELKELFINNVRNQLDGGKNLDIYGANISIRPTGVHYDFTECGDIYLNELYRIQEVVKTSIKQREEEIKAMLPPDDNKTLGIRSRLVVQEHMPHFEFVEHGQDNTIFPPIKRSKESIFVLFKKKE